MSNLQQDQCALAQPEQQEPKVVKTRNKTLLHNLTTSAPTMGPLATTTITTLQDFFDVKVGHHPSTAMWQGLADLAQILERMANGDCPRQFYLSSLDPGVGKTQTIVHFIRALLSSPAHEDVGVIICVSRLNEIKSLTQGMGLSDDQYAILTADKKLNSLGSGRPRASRILFTTQQMVERRCEGHRFEEVDTFFHRGKPRQVRIWDESILPGQTLTLNRDDIATLFRPLRGAAPDLVSDIEAMFRESGEVEDGAQYAIPDLAAKHGIDLNGVLGLLGRPNGSWRRSTQSNDSSDQIRAASDLWLLAGKAATVRRDGGYGATILDFKDTLPPDLAPVVILDASGRVRRTYHQWETKRGGLVRLKAAIKSYDNLIIHVWTRGGGKGAFIKNGQELADGIATTINTKPQEEWLVVHHKRIPGRLQLEDDVRALIQGDQGKVHFVSWGNHSATNAYSRVPNVILAGTLFYRASHYESLGRLAAGFGSDLGPYPKSDCQAVQEGEHSHLILQALCRGSVRLCRGNVCAPCNAYIIASHRTGIPKALATIFPECKVKRWQPIQKALRGKVKDAVEYLDQWFISNPDGRLPFVEVSKALGMTSANFRKGVRHHLDFEEARHARNILEHGNGKYPRYFVRATAEYYGFTD